MTTADDQRRVYWLTEAGRSMSATIPSEAGAASFSVGGPCPICGPRRVVAWLRPDDRRFACAPDVGGHVPASLRRWHVLPEVFWRVACDEAAVEIWREGRRVERVPGVEGQR